VLFMSVEVAAQKFLFTPGTGLSLTEFNEIVSATGQGEGTAQSKVPFFPNHLHDLESLWWVAVWIVFYNYFSEGTPSGDRPSLTSGEVEDQVNLARSLFPPVLESTTRRDAFQTLTSFPNICDKLSDNKKTFTQRLDLLRRLLINHYGVVEARYPRSVDPDASNDGIYDAFKQLFFNLKTDSHNLVLDFIPDIYKAQRNLENSKRSRSESTNDTRVARKTQRT